MFLQIFVNYCRIKIHIWPHIIVWEIIQIFIIEVDVTYCYLAAKKYIFSECTVKEIHVIIKNRSGTKFNVIKT